MDSSSVHTDSATRALDFPGQGSSKVGTPVRTGEKVIWCRIEETDLRTVEGSVTCERESMYACQSADSHRQKSSGMSCS
ncbi:hypothetical protein [Streptomyces sp. NPDC051219]|uniref:hypothetical protein n=1 Tax=Streptomyces sp. NPDC051219 TaxID=3155283 RepID=UPI003413942B